MAGDSPERRLAGIFPVVGREVRVSICVGRAGLAWLKPPVDAKGGSAVRTQAFSSACPGVGHTGKKER